MIFTDAEIIKGNGREEEGEDRVKQPSALLLQFSWDELTNFVQMQKYM